MAGSALQAKASAVWVELWRLAGEKWPPDNVPAAWRVYQHLKEALVNTGATEAQAVAFADEFFYGEGRWGDLSHIENHKRPIDALTATLLDVELSCDSES
jgi:hypothetical protein